MTRPTSKAEPGSVRLVVVAIALLVGGCGRTAPPPVKQPPRVRAAAGPIPDSPPLSVLLKGPTLTPYTVAPEILNRDEVTDVRDREYPEALKRRGVTGTARVYILLDEDGQILKTVLDQSSGNEELDAAALRVAAVFRFTPATRGDAKVPVWISIPVGFGS